MSNRFVLEEINTSKHSIPSGDKCIKQVVSSYDARVN